MVGAPAENGVLLSLKAYKHSNFRLNSLNDPVDESGNADTNDQVFLSSKVLLNI